MFVSPTKTPFYLILKIVARRQYQIRSKWGIFVPFRSADLLPPPPLIYTRKKGSKTRTLQCRDIISKLKISPCLECGNQKNHVTPVKFESKKQAKKEIAQAVGRRKFPIERLGSRYVPPTIPTFMS